MWKMGQGLKQIRRKGTRDRWSGPPEPSFFFFSSKIVLLGNKGHGTFWKELNKFFVCLFSFACLYLIKVCCKQWSQASLNHTHHQGVSTQNSHLKLRLYFDEKPSQPTPFTFSPWFSKIALESANGVFWNSSSLWFSASLKKKKKNSVLITTNQGLCVTGKLDSSQVAGRQETRRPGLGRKHLVADAIAKDRLFYPWARVSLDAFQVINSYGDRTVHWTVSSSARTECELWGLWHGSYVGWLSGALFSSLWGLSVLCAFTSACGQTSPWTRRTKWPHGNSLVVTLDCFKMHQLGGGPSTFPGGCPLDPQRE